MMLYGVFTHPIASLTALATVGAGALIYHATRQKDPAV